MVGAQNHDGEMTAVQTVLLDPSTAHKVAEHAVGAVKRTRGELKGSAVLVHEGNSNQVIIAEGPETAASLIQAEPDANIYATLGNIKNATELSWLAEKHHTDTFHFAADFDGPDAKSMHALKEVTEDLQKEHQIKSIVSTPDLPNHEKYDFNDVLREKGIDAVKQQFTQSQPIANKQHEDRALLSAPDIHARLHDNIHEWERLSTLKSNDIDNVIKYKGYIDKSTDIEDTKIFQEMFEYSVKDVIEQKSLFSQVQSIAPNLANTFQEISDTDKAIKKTVGIDWLSADITKEFTALQQSEDSDHKLLVKLHQILKKEPDDAMVMKQLESLTLSLLRYPSEHNALKSLAPTLATQAKSLVQSKTRRRER